MKRYLPFVIIALVATAAITSGALLYRAKKAELTPLATAPDGSATAASQAGAKPPHVRGQAKAPVTLEEFGDFQCPPCSMLSPFLGKLEEEYGAKLRVIFRQYPLQMHVHAPLAARASEAAGLQGRFWEMHDLLYRNRETWSIAKSVPAVFNEYAVTLGLDLERFKKDIESQEVKARVAADMQRATSLGVNSTPTIFINNRVLPPSSLNERDLRAAIDAALTGNPPPTPTPAPTATPTLTPTSAPKP